MATGWPARSTDYGDLAWFEEQGHDRDVRAPAGRGDDRRDTGRRFTVDSAARQERALSRWRSMATRSCMRQVRALRRDTRNAASIRTTIARALKWGGHPAAGRRR